MKISKQQHRELADYSKQDFEAQFQTLSQNVTSYSVKKSGKLVANIQGNCGIGHLISCPNGRLKIILNKNMKSIGWKGYDIMIADGKHEEINHLVHKRVFVNFSLQYNGWINNKHQYTIGASVAEFPKATMETQPRVVETTLANSRTKKAKPRPTSSAKKSSAGDWTLVLLCLAGCAWFMVGS